MKPELKKGGEARPAVHGPAGTEGFTYPARYGENGGVEIEVGHPGNWVALQGEWLIVRIEDGELFPWPAELPLNLNGYPRRVVRGE